MLEKFRRILLREKGSKPLMHVAVTMNGIRPYSKALTEEQTVENIFKAYFQYLVSQSTIVLNEQFLNDINLWD